MRGGERNQSEELKHYDEGHDKEKERKRRGDNTVSGQDQWPGYKNVPACLAQRA